jgi:hypothetical protein
VQKPKISPSFKIYHGTTGILNVFLNNLSVDKFIQHISLTEKNRFLTLQKGFLYVDETPNVEP